MVRGLKRRVSCTLFVLACANVSSAAAPARPTRDAYTASMPGERIYRMWTDEYGELWCGGSCGGVCCRITPVLE